MPLAMINEKDKLFTCNICGNEFKYNKEATIYVNANNKNKHKALCSKKCTNEFLNKWDKK